MSPKRKKGGNQYKNYRHDKVAQVLHWNLCAQKISESAAQQNLVWPFSGKIACEQAQLFGRAKRAVRHTCLSRVYFERYPSSGGLARRLSDKKNPDLVKLLWDFGIQTDHILDHSRLEIVVLKKEGRAWVLPRCWCSLPFWYTGSRKREREDATTIETRGKLCTELGSPVQQPVIFSHGVFKAEERPDVDISRRNMREHAHNASSIPKTKRYLHEQVTISE